MNHDDQQDPQPDPKEPPVSPEPRPESIDESNWLDDRYPLVDADFVDETLDRVLQDQSEIAAEANQVDDVQFDPAELAELRSPEPSTGFVDATLQKVLAERSVGQWSSDALEAEFQDLLGEFEVPVPTASFVDATLGAVLADRRPALSSGAPTATLPKPILSHPTNWRRPFSIVASVAALLLCAIALFWTDPTPEYVRSAPDSFASLILESDRADGASSSTDAFDALEISFELEDPITGFAVDDSELEEPGEENK